MTRPGAIAPSSESRAAGGEMDTARAARELEAWFLRQVLAEVRASDGALLDKGFAGATFRELLDEALADAMARGGGMGLARVIERSLEARADVPRAPGSGAATPSPPDAVPLPTTSPFGLRTDPIDGSARFHAGVDLRAPEGTAVRAAAAGVVVRAGPAGGYGNLVVLDHGAGVESRYAHLREVAVRPGEPVAADTPIGAVGRTGRATGAHLHFEVRRDGRPIDPTSERSPLKFPR